MTPNLGARAGHRTQAVVAALLTTCFVACEKKPAPVPKEKTASALVAQPTAADISDAEAEQYYRDHSAEFMTGERVRISDIHTRDRRTADRMLAAARALARTNAEGFAALARTNSTPSPHRMGNGDLGWLDSGFPVHPPPVINAAFALANPGDISAVVSAPDGFHVLRLAARTSRRLRSFTEAKSEAKARLFSKRRAEEFQKKVAERAGVKP